MALRDIRKIRFHDVPTAQLQDAVCAFTSQLVKNPRLDGLLIEDVVLVFGETTTVDHGLGRKIRGFEVVYKNNSVEVWAEDTNQTYPLRQLVLSTSADATVSLWVF